MHRTGQGGPVVTMEERAGAENRCEQPELHNDVYLDQGQGGISDAKPGKPDLH